MEWLSISSASSSPSSLRFLHGNSTPLCYAFKPKVSIPSRSQRSLRPLLATPVKSSKTLSLELGAESPYFDFQLSDPQTPDSSFRAAEADVMELLLRERIVFLGSYIDDVVADAIVGQLLLLDAQDSAKDIKLFINSAGGDFNSTLGIFDVIQHVRADVSTVALGVSMSTASILLGCGTKGKRFAMPNTRIMIHQPVGGAQGPVVDLEIRSKEILGNKNTVIRIISDFTGRPFEQVEQDINKDLFMSAAEALEYGVIDAVIDRHRMIPILPIPNMADLPSSDDDDLDAFFDTSSPVPDDEIY